MRSSFRRMSVVGSVCVIMFLALSACGKQGPIDAKITDFAFALSQTTAKAGPVTFRITNNGSVTHEFVVMQTDLSPEQLPKSADGSVDEEKLTSMGEQGDIEPGKAVDLTLDLHPGKYMIICNLPDHFKQGMYIPFTATP